MPIWFNYRLVAPLRDMYVDDGTRILATGDVIRKDVGHFQVSLIGSETSVEMIRIATLDSDGKLTSDQSETITNLMDHMLSVLRFTYKPDADWVRIGGDQILSFGTHDTDGSPNLSVSIEDIVGEPAKVQADNIRNFFIASTNVRPLFKLLSDTQDERLPLQYRYLSLYKAYELEFREGKKWPNLANLFAPYEERYKALNVSKMPLENLLHSLRDKCAHIKTGGEIGIIGIDGPGAKAVQGIYPLLREIFMTYVPTKYAGLHFIIQNPDPSPDPNNGANDDVVVGLSDQPGAQ